MRACARRGQAGGLSLLWDRRRADPSSLRSHSLAKNAPPLAALGTSGMTQLGWGELCSKGRGGGLALPGERRDFGGEVLCNARDSQNQSTPAGLIPSVAAWFRRLKPAAIHGKPLRGRKAQETRVRNGRQECLPYLVAALTLRLGLRQITRRRAAWSRWRKWSTGLAGPVAT